MIARFKNNSYRWSPLAMALVIALGCASLTDARSGEAPQRPAPQSTANLKAFKLSPADGAEGVGVNGLELAWLAGDKAKANNVYLGLDPENLKLLGQVEPVGAKVSHLKCNTKYYWRVDEVQADGSVVSGSVNAFTTGGLAAWWKLDEPSGDIAHDSSGGANHGTLHGDPQRVKDPSGGALFFHGIDDYVDCGSAPSLMQVGSVSVAAWIRLGARNRDAKIVSNQDQGSGYKLGVYLNNKVEFEIRIHLFPDVTPTTNRSEPGGTELQEGIWYHVVGVYEKGRYIRTYVNGQLDRDLETPEIAAISRGPLVIGRESLGPTNLKTYWWLGALRDVCVFTYALNADEVSALYSATTPTALTAPPVFSDAEIVLAPLDTRTRLAPPPKAKSPFGELATENLNAWVKLQVLEQRVVVLDTLKSLSDYWPRNRHKVVGAFSERETLDYLQGRLKDKKSLPIRIHIYYLPETKPAAEALRQKIFTLAGEAHAEMDTEVRLELSVYVGMGESPFYLREGKITTFYPHIMPRPDGGPKPITSGVVDPNDLEQHILWRLTMPKNVPLFFRIEYDEASSQLAMQVADTAKAVAKRVGLTDLVSAAGIPVKPVPESAFLGKWQAQGRGVIQNVDIQPGGVCQVTVGEGSEAFKAGTSVRGTWAWMVKQILLNIDDHIKGSPTMPSYVYRATVDGEGNLVIERGEIYPQGNFMVRSPQMVFKRAQ